MFNSQLVQADPLVLVDYFLGLVAYYSLYMVFFHFHACLMVLRQIHLMELDFSSPIYPFAYRHMCLMEPQYDFDY